MVRYFLKSGLGVLNPLVLIRGFLLYMRSTEVCSDIQQNPDFSNLRGKRRGNCLEKNENRVFSKLPISQTIYVSLG